MAKREFIENMRNGKCKLINKNCIDKELVDIKDLYASIEECHVFTEQEIVKPYLEKLKAKMFDLPKADDKTYWDAVDDIGDLIDNLLSEQGDTDRW